MEKIKKIFGGINLTWLKLIIFAIVAGVYTGVIALIPQALDTSFIDITTSFEVWILFGILIIMNSKSAKDSALKCFVFFLISQPLVYLVQDVITHDHLLITYYRHWVLWTVATLPMGFFGYFMKKDKWWGLVILTPILLFLGEHYATYLGKTIFSFPRHLLTTLFCFTTLILYPWVIFHDKKIQMAGIIISVLIILAMTALSLINLPVYSTDLISSGEKYDFDDTYKVYLTDNKYGTLRIRYEDALECYMVHAELKKAGKTSFILESPTGEKQEFEITIRRDSYDIQTK